MPSFIAVVTAKNRRRKGKEGVLISTIVASDIKRAEKMALERAKEGLPQFKGYFDYNVITSELSKESLRAIFEQLEAEARWGKEIKIKGI